MLNRAYVPVAIAMLLVTIAACALRSPSRSENRRDDGDVAVVDHAAGASTTARPLPSIEATYDAEFDRTVFRVSLPAVEPGTELSITAKQHGRGTLIPADSVEMFLTHVGAERKFRRGDDLDILIDGTSYMLFDNLDVTVTRMRAGYVEQAGVAVSLADFVTIANATAAGAKFGDFSFWLAGAQLDVLRAFAIRVGVDPVRPR